MGKSSKRKRQSQTREVHIPTELVTEILTRLPSKTIMRFKCVSKLWASLIRSQYFSNRFLMVSPQQRLYMCFWDDINCSKDESKSVILSLVPDATNPSSFLVDHNVTIPWLGFHNLQNLHGFMWSSDSKTPRIYNPTTRQLVTLPATSPCSRVLKTFYYFGHDPVNDQYKVICSKTSYKIRSMPICRRRRPMPGIGLVTRLKQWVLVLKPGASWKEVDPTSNHMPISRPGVSINGRIFYQAFTDISDYVVVSFDIESEKFENIQAPHVDGGLNKGSLIEYGGKVAIFYHTHLKDKGKVDLWILKDVENKTWSKKTLVLQPSQLNLVHNIHHFEVKGTTQIGKVLLIPRDLGSPFHILCYDLKNNDMTKIDINRKPDHWFDKKAANICFSRMYMDQGESIAYLRDLN